VADVVDLVPTFRMRAGGSLVEARVSLFAAYGEEEIAVRADGMSLPVLIQPPEEGTSGRAASAWTSRRSRRGEQLEALGLKSDETGQGFAAHGDAAIRFWSEGLAELPEDWDLFVYRRTWWTRRSGRSRSASSRRSRAEWTGSTSS
jgi:hypothetical protein